MAFRNNVYCDNIQEVKECIHKCSNMVCHVMKANDNEWNSPFIVVAHIVCDYCSLCETQGDVRCKEIESLDIPEYQEVTFL